MHAKKILLFALKRNNFSKNIQFIFNIQSIVNIEVDGYRESDYLVKLCRERDASLFLNIYKNYITIGRLKDNQLIDIFQYEIEEYDERKINLELFFKYYLIFNRVEKEEANIFVDILRNKHSTVNLESIKYILLFEKNKFVLYDEQYTIISEVMKLRLKNKIYKTELESENRKNKNIKKDEFNNLIGTVYRPREDLKRIKIRKYK